MRKLNTSYSDLWRVSTVKFKRNSLKFCWFVPFQDNSNVFVYVHNTKIKHYLDCAQALRVTQWQLQMDKQWRRPQQPDINQCKWAHLCCHCARNSYFSFFFHPTLNWPQARCWESPSSPTALEWSMLLSQCPTTTAKSFLTTKRLLSSTSNLVVPVVVSILTLGRHLHFQLWFQKCFKCCHIEQLEHLIANTLLATFSLPNSKWNEQVFESCQLWA